MKIAVVYISKNGTTANTVEQMRAVAGSSVKFFDLQKEPKPDISDRDKIYVGCGIYAGTVPKPMRDFLSSPVLEQVDVEFFIHALDSLTTYKTILSSSVKNNAWMAKSKMHYLGGTCDMEKQSFMVRQVLKMIAKKKNLDVNHMENLDPDAIKNFLDGFENECTA